MGDWFQDWFDEDYARLYAHRDEAEARLAVATALRAAPALGSGPVLDLACGAGRHLSVLRERNPEAFGIDLSPALLRLAPEALRPWLLRADMRKLPLKAGSLSGIALWFTPFGYFSDEENAALLAELKRLLKPGGALLMDYLNAAQLRAHLVPEDTVERNGIRVHSKRRFEGERVVKELELLCLESGETRQAVESVRVYAPGELVELAAAAGLIFQEDLGDYSGAPYADNSPRWIGIFEAR